jgi:hypothetical protein
MITVISSWGYIYLDDKGNVESMDVLEHDGEERCYLLDAVKFDLVEWDDWYEKRFNEPSIKPDDFDVLEIGFWNKDGSYNVADKKWRDEVYI